jgi:hypothetical protein
VDGGSGFAIMPSMNFPDWRHSMAGRMKLKQTVDVLQDVISPDIRRIVCAPCYNRVAMAHPKRRHKDTRVKINLPFDEALAVLARAPRPGKFSSAKASARSDDTRDAASADNPRVANPQS